MKKEEYIFTGFMPSGNPFKWYYDENKPCVFDSSISVSTYTKQPIIGDRMTYLKDENFEVQKVFINDELVYERTHETIAEEEKKTNEIYDKLKKEKGWK